MILRILVLLFALTYGLHAQSGCVGCGIFGIPTIADNEAFVGTGAGTGTFISLGSAGALAFNGTVFSQADLPSLASSTSAELLALISDETGTGLAVFATAPTFTTSILTPVVISGDADPADAGVLRLGNTEVIGWEAATPGTDLTLLVDASDILQASGAVNIGGALTVSTNAVADSTTTLDFFSATTSAQLLGLISDETGTGLAVFATAPTFTTSILTPVVISGDADPADAGVVRLGNTETIAWEAATPGTDLTVEMNASDIFDISVGLTSGGDIVSGASSCFSFNSVSATCRNGGTGVVTMTMQDAAEADFNLVLTNATSQFLVTADASQSANIQEWRDSGGTPMVAVGAAGGIDTTSGTVTFADSANVASGTTTTLTVGNLFHITGTTTITTLDTCDAANNGREVFLIFDGILTFTDGNNLKIAGNFVTTADDTIQLVCDGTNWYEIGTRSVN